LKKTAIPWLMAILESRPAARYNPITMSDYGFSRRYFFYGGLLAGAVPAGGFGSAPSLSQVGYRSPNEKLNVAGIGAGNQALGDLRSVAQTENIVALADVDDRRAAQGFTTWPAAHRYRDFRKMLDQEGSAIDAVVIAIPDHNHAYAALWSMERKKHVYVEKPLTRTPWEARLMTRAAQKYGVATQMGNQGHSSEAARVACEIVWSGEIGDVTEIHSWNGYPGWPQGMQAIPPEEAVPSTIDWDLWLGTAAWRPYTSGGYDDLVRNGMAGNLTTAYSGGFYQPFNWRGFYDFGSGLLGDWGIHIFGPANQALRLGNPISVECIRQEGKSKLTYPQKCVIKYEFGARPKMPPVTLYWYDSSPGNPYFPPGMDIASNRVDATIGPTLGAAVGGRGGAAAGGRGAAPAAARGGAAPAGAAAGRGAAGRGAAGRGGGGGGMQASRGWPGGDAFMPGRTAAGGAAPPPSSGDNQILVGTKGFLATRGHGDGVRLLPNSRWADYRLPTQTLTRSPGHQRDWIRACKGGDPACSNFSYAGPFTEWVVLGAISVRFEGKLLWDAAKMEFTNNKAANGYIKPAFRKGWEIKDV
jgi:predicted dehydrogenase